MDKWNAFIESCRAELHRLRAQRAGGPVTPRESWVFFVLYQHYMAEDLGPGPLLDEFGDEYLVPVV